MRSKFQLVVAMVFVVYTAADPGYSGYGNPRMMGKNYEQPNYDPAPSTGMVPWNPAGFRPLVEEVMVPHNPAPKAYYPEGNFRSDVGYPRDTSYQQRGSDCGGGGCGGGGIVPQYQQRPVATVHQYRPRPAVPVMQQQQHSGWRTVTNWYPAGPVRSQYPAAAVAPSYQVVNNHDYGRVQGSYAIGTSYGGAASYGADVGAAVTSACTQAPPPAPCPPARTCYQPPPTPRAPCPQPRVCPVSACAEYPQQRMPCNMGC